MSYMFIKYGQRETQKGDLADIASHYKLQPIHPGAEELEPSGPSSFWVVEKERPDKNGRTIIGFIGLGVMSFIEPCFK